MELDAGGKPSTWLPPGKPVEPSKPTAERKVLRTKGTLHNTQQTNRKESALTTRALAQRPGAFERWFESRNASKIMNFMILSTLGFHLAHLSISCPGIKFN